MPSSGSDKVSTASLPPLSPLPVPLVAQRWEWLMAAWIAPRGLTAGSIPPVADVEASSASSPVLDIAKIVRCRMIFLFILKRHISSQTCTHKTYFAALFTCLGFICNEEANKFTHLGQFPA